MTRANTIAKLPATRSPQSPTIVATPPAPVCGAAEGILYGGGVFFGALEALDDCVVAVLVAMV